MWKEVFHIQGALCPARNWEAQTKKTIAQIKTTQFSLQFALYRASIWFWYGGFWSSTQV